MAAKGLRDFAKANPLLIIKGGVLDGKSLTADEIRKLADLESREVLLAKMAGAMLASLSGAAALFQAPLAKAARLTEALRQKAEADPSILRGGAGTPAPVTVAEVIEARARAARLGRGRARGCRGRRDPEPSRGRPRPPRLRPQPPPRAMHLQHAEHLIGVRPHQPPTDRPPALRRLMKGNRHHGEAQQ